VDNKTKIRVGLGDSSIEIEGTEEYVEMKLKDPDSLIPILSSLRGIISSTTNSNKEPVVKETKEESIKEKKRRTISKGLESYKILPNLDLEASGDIPSLVDFYHEKSPSSAQERNPVFVYFLKKMKNIENVGLDHIYTCYKKVGATVPAKLYQSLIDTRRGKGTVITDKMDDIGIGIIGENFVEKELPTLKKPKK